MDKIAELFIVQLNTFVSVLSRPAFLLPVVGSALLGLIFFLFYKLTS